MIYRMSPMLNHATERPLLYEETVPLLEHAGLRSIRYQTHGFFGFCLFMNSDVLFVNRLFRFVPGIRAITLASTRSDGAILALPGLWRAGLQVVGICAKNSWAVKLNWHLQATIQILIFARGRGISPSNLGMSLNLTMM